MKEGWEIKKLGEVCEISTGKSNTEDAVKNGQYAFFDRSKVIKKSTKYLFDCDAIIVAGEGQTFLPKFYSGKFDLHQRAYAIFNFDKNVSVQYVYKYLIHFHKYFEEVAVGATAKSLRLRHFQDLPIPLPPLPEQQRIVSILDEAFAAIAKAKANAEQNLRNAKEVFESYLQGVFEGKGKGWEEKRLGDVVDNIMTGPFGSMLHKSDYVEVGIPVVNPQNLVDGQIIPLQKTMINKTTFNRLEKYALKNGDIVIARRGEMGRCAIVKNSNVGWLCGTGSFVIRVNKKKADSEFLNIVLSSAEVKKELEKSSIGATMSNLNQSILSELLLKVPSVIDQQTIVQKLDALSAETKKLEIIYQQKINDLEEMKKSILQKAFSGGLHYDSGE